jgi:hypothetical protein
MPFGTTLNDSPFISFCSRRQNGQWSVLTTASVSSRSPLHRSRWWCSCLERSGVEQM